MTTEHHPQCDDNGWDHPGECVVETNPIRTWNVRAVVVELIEAPTALDAINELAARLSRAGFEPDDYHATSDAFESEPLS